MSITRLPFWHLVYDRSGYWAKHAIWIGPFLVTWGCP